MNILRGRFEPVVGYSPALTSIIYRCLSQASARRPTAERLLRQPDVQAKAAELGVVLPTFAAAALSPVPSAGLVGEPSSGGRPRAAGRSASARRATCPNNTPEGGCLAPLPSMRGERRKPPLPAAAVPRRRTVQVCAAAAGHDQPLQLPSRQEAAAAEAPMVLPERRTRISIERLSQLSEAAQQFLQQRGGAGAAAVQRSAVSDSCLMVPPPRFGVA